MAAADSRHNSDEFSAFEVLSQSSGLDPSNTAQSAVGYLARKVVLGGLRQEGSPSL